jgi:hypothetical protein
MFKLQYCLYSLLTGFGCFNLREGAFVVCRVGSCMGPGANLNAAIPLESNPGRRARKQLLF